MENNNLSCFNNFNIDLIRKLANSTSFKRGLEYFYDNRVGKITRTGYNFSGKINGSETYQLSIDFSGDNPEFKCDCAYSYDGICKHQVAFALTIINGKFSPQLEASDQPDLKKRTSMSFMDYFAKIDDKIKINFLKQLLDKNIDLQNQFLTFSESKSLNLDVIAGENIETIKKDVNDELSTLDFDDIEEDDYYDNYGNYNDNGLYDNACEMIEDVIKPYTIQAQKYISNGNPIDSFRIILGVFEGSQNLPELDNRDCYLFEGEYNYNVQKILENEINKLSKLYNETVISDEHIFKIIDIFEERYNIFLNDTENLNEIDENEIDEEEDDNDDNYDDENDTIDNKKAWNLKILSDLFISFITNADIAEYFLKVLRKNNLEIQSFSYLLLKLTKALNDTDRWIEFAEKFSISDKSICLELLDKYRELNHKDLFIKKIEFALDKWERDFDKYLIDFVDKYENRDLYQMGLTKYSRNKRSIKHYNELREYLNENEKFEFINSVVRESPVFYVNMLEIEQKYDKILEYILKVKDSDYISGFNDCILPILNIYPKECFEILSDKCNKALESYNRSRSTYNTMTGWLNLMLKIENFKIPSMNFITGLYYHKPNLPALRDEMGKAGLTKYVYLKK